MHKLPLNLESMIGIGSEVGVSNESDIPITSGSNTLRFGARRHEVTFLQAVEARNVRRITLRTTTVTASIGAMALGAWASGGGKRNVRGRGGSARRVPGR